MKRPWTWWLAWGLWGAFVVLITATVIIDATTVSRQEEGESLTSDIGIVIAFSAFATVGALVASRLPRNAVGWLFLASPLFGTVAGFSAEYAYRAYVTDPGSVPAGSLFGWLYSLDVVSRSDRDRARRAPLPGRSRAGPALAATPLGVRRVLGARCGRSGDLPWPDRPGVAGQAAEPTRESRG